MVCFGAAAGHAAMSWRDRLSLSGHREVEPLEPGGIVIGNLLAAGRFHLRTWVTNSPSLTDDIAEMIIYTLRNFGAPQHALWF